MATRSLICIVPGRIDARTGGSIYDRRMVEGLRQQGWSVDVRELDGSFPRPSRLALEQAARVFADVAAGAAVLVDGLALSAMPEVIEREASRLRIAALVHLPLAADVSMDRETAAHLEDGERRALSAAALIVVTGTATLAMLQRYEPPAGKVHVVEPGTDQGPLARRTDAGAGQPLRLLSVGSLHPGKGHESLLRALAAVPHHNWRLTCAGSLTRDPATVAQVQGLTRRLGLDDHVSLAGELDVAALGACYENADLFVLATLQETYGMAVAEALAHGLPVVSTTTGAIPDLVGDDAGFLVPPGNTAALTDALSRAMGDAELRARLAEGARRVRARLPSWEHAAATMSAVLHRLDNHG